MNLSPIQKKDGKRVCLETAYSPENELEFGKVYEEIKVKGLEVDSKMLKEIMVLS